jgi:hypothetical protein
MTSLLIGYAASEAGQEELEVGAGPAHAYVEDDADETLCGKPILDATHRSFPPDQQSDDEVCPQCLELGTGL